MRRWAAVAAAVVAAVTVGCGGDGDGRPRVLAASSLSEVFTELADGEVELTFGASSALAVQVREGAGASVLASADVASMRTVTADFTVFARNRLEIAVRPANPEGIRSLADLARPGVVTVLCAPEVPCGRYAALALDRAGVEVEPASLEENVRAVLAKVALGEADAGIVYATDVLAAGGDVDGVEVAGAADPDLLATYVVAALDTEGEAFVRRLVGPEGRAALRRRGFLLP